MGHMVIGVFQPGALVVADDADNCGGWAGAGWQGRASGEASEMRPTQTTTPRAFEFDKLDWYIFEKN